MSQLVGPDGSKVQSVLPVNIPGLAVGRIVHYFQVDEKGPHVFAAIVTAVGENGVVDLTVFIPEQTGFVNGCPHFAGGDVLYKDGCWSWPPKA